MTASNRSRTRSKLRQKASEKARHVANIQNGKDDHAAGRKVTSATITTADRSASASTSAATGRRRPSAGIGDRQTRPSKYRTPNYRVPVSSRGSATSCIAKMRATNTVRFDLRPNTTKKGKFEITKIQPRPLARFTIDLAYSVYLENADISQNTFVKDQSYLRSLKSFFGHRKLSEIGADEIAEYREFLRARPGRRNNLISDAAANNYLTFYKKIAMGVYKNGFCRVAPYIPKTRSPTWSSPILRERIALELLKISQLDLDLNARLLFALTFGLLRKAACLRRLLRRDVDLKAGTISLPVPVRSAKCGATCSQKVPIGRAFMRLIKAALRRGKGPYLLHYNDKPIGDTKYILRRIRDCLVSKLSAQRARTCKPAKRREIDSDIQSLSHISINCLRDFGIDLLISNGFSEGAISAMANFRSEDLVVRFAGSRAEEKFK